MKVLISTCYGGFGVSQEFKDAYPSIFHPDYFYDWEVFFRTDPEVIAAVEEFGTDKASGGCAHIVVAEIPDNATDYYIDEYDGAENLIYVLNGKIRFWKPDDED